MTCHALVDDAGNVIGTICRSGEWTAWEPIPESWSDPIVTDCCVCKTPRADCEVRWLIAEWYDPSAEIRCREGKGCDANPRRKRGSDYRRECRGSWEA